MDNMNLSDEKKTKQKLQAKKASKVFFGLVFTFSALILISWFFMRNTESTNDAQIAGHIADVASRIEGQVLKVYVENNAHVKAGDPLVLLDNSFQLANVELAEADFDAAVANFKQATVDVEQARASYKSALSAKELELKNLNRVLSLQKQNAISQQAVDQQQKQYDQSLANLEAAKAVLYMSGNMSRAFGNKFDTKDREKLLSYSQKMKGFNPSLDAALAKLKKAKANLDLANLNLNFTVIRSPFEGVIGNKHVEIGKNVNPNAPLLSVVSLTDIWIEANFKETQLRSLKSQQRASIWVDAYGNKKFEGIVTGIGPASGQSFALLPADNSSGNFVKVTQRIPVRIDFKKIPEEILRPGMSVETKIETK